MLHNSTDDVVCDYRLEQFHGLTKYFKASGKIRLYSYIIRVLILQKILHKKNVEKKRIRHEEEKPKQKPKNNVGAGTLTMLYRIAQQIGKNNSTSSTNFGKKYIFTNKALVLLKNEANENHQDFIIDASETDADNENDSNSDDTSSRSSLEFELDETDYRHLKIMKQLNVM